MDEFGAVRNAIHSNSAALRALTKKFDESDKTKDRVDISLDKYEAMRDEIDRLTKESHEWRQKFETLCAFLEETHLPLDALGSGKGQDVQWETLINPINMSVIYNISVTVQDVDLYRYERARLYNEQID